MQASQLRPAPDHWRLEAGHFAKTCGSAAPTPAKGIARMVRCSRGRSSLLENFPVDLSRLRLRLHAELALQHSDTDLVLP